MSDPSVDPQPEPMPHGIPPRGLASTPTSSTTQGRFGRMFRHVPVFRHDPGHLIALGGAMVQGLEDGKLDKPLGVQDEDENVGLLDGTLRLPAGYTYLGQFVDHDITFDPTSSLTQQNDPDALVDFRTPRFDLDSLYGRGPDDQPYLYEPDGLHLKLGEKRSADPAFEGPDLQRQNDGRALIGDPRNDENLIISQLQVAFTQLHNAVLDRVKADQPGLAGHGLLEETQRTVRWHYQWVVINDFLRCLVGPEVIDDLLPSRPFQTPQGPSSVRKHQPLFYTWREKPFMPVEFSVAAYRFGHSIIRPSYLINDVIPVPVVDVAARIPLFSDEPGELTHLNGFRPLPEEWGLQWKYFLPGIKEGAGPNDANLPQPSYRLDAEISNPLGLLPVGVAHPQVLVEGVDPNSARSLPVRNLLRGLRLGLPSGQDVAHAMGISPLSDEELLGDVGIEDDAKAHFGAHAPLWFYILKEAKVQAQAEHLGAVGGRIVAEVLIGLLAGDPLSFLSVDPTWTPTLPTAVPGTFTLSDLINFARPGGAAPGDGGYQEPGASSPA